MTDTPSGETATQEEVKNNVTTPSVPTQVTTTDNGEAEKLRKELEQAQMRTNQLQNQLDAKAKAEEEARNQALEEQNEFKSLYEQEKAKREASENERQEAEAKEALRISQEAIFAEFPEDAIDIAKEAGLGLAEDSEEAKTALKERMQKIADKVVSTNKVTPNNPGAQVQNDERAELVKQMRYGNKEARAKVINTLPVLDQMRKQAGYTNQ